MSFLDDPRDRTEATDSVVSVGLDVDIDRLPDYLFDKNLLRWAFNRHIINATHEHATVFKPNAAFYEDEDGWCPLRETIVYARGEGVPVLPDAKRAGIGNMTRKYADLLDDADAITVNPHMGRDSIQPFLSREDKGMFVLCHTSDPGGADFQSPELDTGKPLHEHVAALCDLWDEHGNVGLVVGATGPDELGHFYEQVPDLPPLVPGVGAQDGDAEAAVEFGLADGAGLVNSSCGTIFTGEDDSEDFDRAVEQVAKRLKNRLNQYR